MRVLQGDQAVRSVLTRGAVREDGDVDPVEDLRNVGLGRGLVDFRLSRLWGKRRVECVLVRGALGVPARAGDGLGAGEMTGHGEVTVRTHVCVVINLNRSGIVGEGVLHWMLHEPRVGWGVKHDPSSAGTKRVRSVGWSGGGQLWTVHDTNLGKDAPQVQLHSER